MVVRRPSPCFILDFMLHSLVEYERIWLSMREFARVVLHSPHVNGSNHCFFVILSFRFANMFLRLPF